MSARLIPLLLVLIVGWAAAPAYAADYDGDGVASPADCDDYDTAIHPGAPDKPDVSAFEDTNCDGIDGDAARAIFVDASAADDNGDGTRAHPKRTLAAAVATARSAARDVYAAAGTFTGPTLALEPGVGVYGGYTNGFAKRAVTSETLITGATTAVLADSGDVGVVLQLVTVRGANATTPGDSSYGLRAINGASVALDHVTAAGGTAAAGAAGDNGIISTPVLRRGTDGGRGSCADQSSRGAAGLSGTFDPGVLDVYGNGGAGANGLTGVAHSAADSGSDGSDAGASGPGKGGAAGTGEWTISTGFRWGFNMGTDGAGGANGTAGKAGSGASFAFNAGVTWIGVVAGGAGESGTNGRHGGGGGGGAGGDSIHLPAAVPGVSGSGGGGGGQGGPGGAGGRGGASGGGSFGVYIHGAAVVAQDSELRGGTGGAGGNGSAGVPGTAGTAGGTGGDWLECPYAVGATTYTVVGGKGGNGGKGGDGGAGGAGGGGAGGPSAGVFRAGGPSGFASINTQQIPGAEGAAGGAGGAGVTPAQPGVSGAVLDQGATNTIPDFDGDGVKEADACPTQAAPGTPTGCPRRDPKVPDTDGDGLPDALDGCPGVKPAVDKDGDGCTDAPPDTDGDGLPDSADACPTTRAATADGCPAPADSDGDGLPDSADACPTTRAATADGCPAPVIVVPGPGATATPTPTPALAAIISFRFSSATTKATTFTSLTLTGISAGATVSVTCKGRGCPRALAGKGYTKRNVAGTVNLAAFVRKPLAAGIVIRVTVSRAGAPSIIKTLTIRKRKAPLLKASS